MQSQAANKVEEWRSSFRKPKKERALAPEGGEEIFELEKQPDRRIKIRSAAQPKPVEAPSAVVSMVTADE